MECNISKPTKRIDVPDKIAGKAKYIGDYKLEGMLYGKTLRSTKARAKIVKIEYPKLPDGYYIVDKDDVPGTNLVKIIINDQPFFADERVNYIGEAIALVVGEDKKEVLNILSKINIEYEELEPILTIDDGLNKSKEAIYGDTNCFGDYEYKKGNVEDIKQKSIYVVEGEYETGYQEQLYLEPQGVIAVCEGDKVSIYGSIQCPYYVKGAVEQCMGPPEDKVRIIQAVTGGGFGGKEDFPSLIAGQAACAALKTKRPVQIIYDRDEDLEVTPKRHPSKIKIKSYLDKDYRILGSEVDIKLDAGAYSGLSNVVLQRTMFAAIGTYNVENVVVKGKSVATNKTVSGAFRGFGAPQAFFAVEMHMEHIAKQLGIDSLEFKMKNLLKKGDKSSTGGIFRENVPLPKMIERVLEVSSYREKKIRFQEERKRGKLKGIGLSLFFHGGGFTGSGEREHIKSKVKLVKHANEIVEILIANVEMGQGTQTSLRKIVAYTLEIPLEKVIYENPDTDRVPNSGPTVASRTTVIVGKLLKDAAEALKLKWNESDKVEVMAEYKHPEGFYWDDEHFIGDAYNSYSWGANVVEVEVDPITLIPSIDKVWAVFDIGNAIDERIVKGQIDGGILQGLGYAGIEVMENKDGRFMQRSNADYIIPTSKDAPKIDSELICEPYYYGPFGAKALGELTLVGSPSAYALAVENATGVSINKIPVRPEHLMEVLEHDK